MTESLLQNRYRIDTELGRGGMGVVYRAHDTLLDRDVAVKVLSEAGLGSEGRARLLREARAAAKLNHPNIVSVYDAGDAGGVPFIVMELVEGESLFDRQPQTLDDILSVARQICAALDHAHAHGIVHRDLKLENVLLANPRTAESKDAPIGTDDAGLSVKLSDFGLARSLASRMTSEGTIIGTVFYLAPEQIRGASVDGRADLYALGVMLYELTTGRLPFDADDPVAVISQHLYAPVVPPSTYVASIWPALDALIVRLLSKQPDDRPASAADVLYVLDHLNQIEAAPGVETELSLLDRIARGKLIGRDRELAEAQAHWQRALGGEGRVLLISGEPGIGKTRLTRELVARAQATGAIILSAECYAEGGAPYAPIAQAFRDAMVDPRYPIEKLRLPEVVIVDMLKLALDPRARQPSADLDPQAEQQRLFESVVAWISALTARAPTLLFVDDVHWADAGTLALLRHVARRSRKLRLLIVLPYREIELDEARPLNDMLGDLSRERLVARVKLTRLTEQQTREMLQSMLGDECTPELAGSIYRETEGNPFFIEEVVKVLVEEEKLYRDDGRWCCAAINAVEIPQSVRVTIQSRVSKLPDLVQETLRLAAVLGREFDFDVLRQAAGGDEDDLIHALEIAEQAQLIEELHRAGSAGRARTTAFSFAHALIPSTLRESLGGLRRQRLHRRVVVAIAALRPDDFETLAYHAAEAGDEERALGYTLRAGDRAKSLYANRDAIKFYTEALALMPAEHPERFEVLASRAAVYDLIAEREAQHADIEAMLALADALHDDARRCDAWIALADYYASTNLLSAYEPAERAVALAQTLRDPVREGKALRQLGWYHYFRAEGMSACETLESSVSRFREAGLGAEAAASLNMLALVHLYNLGDKKAALKAAEEAVALSRQAGDRRQEAVSLRRLAMVYGAQKRRAEELSITEQSLALSRAVGNRSEERNALFNLGMVYAHLGKLDDSERSLRQSLELAHLVGSASGFNNAAHALVRYHYHRRGEYEAALAFIDEQIALAQAAKDEGALTGLVGNSVLTVYRLGRYERALALALDTLVFVEKHLGAIIQSNVHSVIGRLQAVLGQFAAARQSLERAIEMVEEGGNSADIAYRWAAQAFIDMVEGEQTGDRETLRRGLEQSRLALPPLRRTESDEDIIDEIHTQVRLLFSLGETDEALARSTEVQEIKASLPAVVAPETLDFTHSQILRRLGREDEANEYLRRAYDWVMLVAGKTRDEVLRKSWLESVRVNRAIVKAAGSQTR